MNPALFWHLIRHHHHQRGDCDVAFAARQGQGRGRAGGPPGGGGPFGGGGPPFGPFGRPPFFRREGRARPGDVRAAILALLAEEPRNGYQLMQAVGERSDGAWRPSPGSMYPALQQLEDEGLVRVDAGAGGRVYHLTAKGRREAEARAGEPPPWEAASDGQAGFTELRELFGQVAAATAEVGQAGTRAQRAAAKKILIDTRRALYGLLADAEEDEPGGRDG
ncbi:MAG: PadR family transcriptional regulator [Polyangiaceae bacterium]|nr:PadR family transcriptional regulator [Polyangiaceae bacterium]